MSASENDRLLGRLAIHYRIMDQATVQTATERFRQAGSDGDFGRFLVAGDWISAEVLEKLERARQVYLARKNETAAAAPAPQAPSVQPAASPPAPAHTVGAAPAPQAVPPAATPESSLLATQPTRVPDESSADDSSTDAESADPEAAGAASPAVSLDMGMMALLEQAVVSGASDLHLHSGARLRMRIDGSLREVSENPVGPGTSERLIEEVLTPEQLSVLANDQQLDLVLELPGVARFRTNVYKQQRGNDAVFRIIPQKPPTFESLGLPSSFESLTDYHQGLVLFTGPTGCGKSSTMAAAIELIAQKRAEHILTIEDPVEFVFPPRKALINQRQVGPHTESFGRALRAALREDPDVIVIGELRDLESISLALTAAETGHLVLATLHTTGAVRTINRLLGVFPPEEQPQVRTMLSESLRAIVSQRLLPKIGGGRVVAVELLLNTPAIANLIRDSKTFQIQSVMQTSLESGMCLLDLSLGRLVKQNLITLEDARMCAEEPDKLESMG